MTCSPLDPLSCAGVLADKIGNAAAATTTASLSALLSALTDQLHEAIKLLALSLAEWLVVPTTGVCPNTVGNWMAACTNGTSPAAQVRAWLLPITALVALFGIVWQGITMTITRKGEPLLTVLKGLFAVTLWGAVGIVGTQLLLRAGDAYSFWVLQQAVFGDSPDPAQAMGDAFVAMDAAGSYGAVILLLLMQIPFLLATLVQILLMFFREAAITILAGQLQLAAAGGFTRLTSGWHAKLTGWTLALIAYKPVAATIYAIAITLMGDGRNLVMGLAIMMMAVIALPALMRLFNWGVGALGNGGGNTVGMLGTTIAAGLHGASAARGLGGYDATDHARWMDAQQSTPPKPPTGAATPGAFTATANSAPSAASTAGAAAGAATAGATAAAQAAADAARRAARQASDAMQVEE